MSRLTVERVSPTFARDACVLVALTAAAAGIAFAFVSEVRGMPAGDAFNFTAAAEHLAHGTYPADEKRLPLYPLFILLGRPFTDDPVVAATAVSAAATSLLPGLLYLLGRRLRLTPLPLALGLLLVVVHPVLLPNGIRPLADSAFLAALVAAHTAVVSLRPTARWRFGTAVLLAVLAHTRYEAIAAALLLLLFLRIRVRWREVGRIALLLLLFSAPWLVASTVRLGAPWNLSYFRCVEECGYGVPGAELPRRLVALAEISGWTKVAEHPAYVRAESEVAGTKGPVVLGALLRASGWWVALAALLGLVWLVVRRPSRGLPVVLTLALTASLVAWWKLHARFAIVAMLLFLFAAAAGFSFFWDLARLLAGSSRLRRAGAASVVTLALLLLLLAEAPGLARAAHARIFESQGQGGALYAAFRFLAAEQGLVAVERPSPMTYALFGGIEGVRPPRLLTFAERYGEVPTANEIFRRLARERPQWLVDHGAPVFSSLVPILAREGKIASEQVFRSSLGLRGERGEEFVSLFHLTWD